MANFLLLLPFLFLTLAAGAPSAVDPEFRRFKMEIDYTKKDASGRTLFHFAGVKDLTHTEVTLVDPKAPPAENAFWTFDPTKQFVRFAYLTEPATEITGKSGCVQNCS
jgi:hypothetical protein